ncbi:ATP-dependent DNA helicase [Firmicutes bacterium AM43-11BH]|uniref:ATP-dependent DNA helicase n=1 Tax=Blautia stercoris TaxID=871664 RepID=A0ABR7PBR1_9FIRM|nr:ATP-dependent DNA helicase [Blautia stercoris]MBC8628834.1 ATP-dependent DNA helicase [Blautia stercoris]RHS76300.1 ATP-dependent DNA helicase [Firmicutes bacterium AM43-11BH]
MFYKVEYQKRAHQEVEKIFRVLLPEQGLAVREEQIRLCHEMLDTLLGERIALCDAGVGIGKTYAYLVACVLLRKYSMLTGRGNPLEQRPVVVSTSSIALQKAIVTEYIPFLSRVLLEQGMIQSPLRAVVRKGKEHFVCDNRLEQRIEAIRHKQKNAAQKEALLSLRKHYDMDTVKDLSGFDRRLVCVPKFCPRECPGRQTCRYQRYLEESKKQDVFLQICNHNYLLADAFHRREEYKPLLADYRALVVDEAHKLPEAARQMFGKNLCKDDIREIAYYLEREHQNVEARTLKAGMYSIFTIIGESHIFSHGIKENFQLTGECEFCLWEGIQMIERMMEQLKGVVPKWVLNRLQEAKEVLECFLQKNSKYVLHLRMDKEKIPVLCAASREIPQLLREMLWDREQALSVILTSGTLKAGKGFARTLQMTGLGGRTDVQSYVAESPFAYEENCLLYLPKTLRKCKRGSREEVEMVAGQIHSLICSTYGHTLVLFTSYTLMGSVYQILRDGIPFPMVEVWRHSQEEILRFKTMENAVLFAAGSCWEGVDFPGDMVSSLIIVKLPFAVPDPISEAEKETYESLEDYIQAIIVPDMQKKLRQGFGRAIRTETDTCVVSILDFRAVKGGKYHEDVMCALPPCQMAEELREVQDFIRSRKGVEYYL